MQAIVWVISGLLAGWLARVVMKERRIGFLADFTLGTLGGVSGAWMLRRIGGSVPPAGSPTHLVVAVLGAMLLAQVLLRPIHVIRSGLTALVQIPRCPARQRAGGRARLAWERYYYHTS